VTVILLGAALAGLALPQTAPTPARPNVVLFMVDDMGWMDSSVYGSEYYLTPNMERLAQSGTTFTRAYSASPVCSPTRASLMTGKSPARLRFTLADGHKEHPYDGEVELPPAAEPWRAGIAVPSRGYLPLSETTLAEALCAAGYRTGFVGKWHLGADERFWPEHQGFETNRGGGGYQGPPGGYFDPYRNARLENRRAGEYLTDRLTDEALAFVDSHREEPFFLCLWHYAVHAPWQYKHQGLARHRHRRDPRGEQGNVAMASMLESVDESLGRVLDRLDELGLLESTLFVFYSDNGGNVTSDVSGLPPTSNAPLRGGKGSIYEGGTRVPLIVAWPGRVAAGVRSDALVTSADFYPTLLEAAGLPSNPEQHVDGTSFLAALEGRPGERRTEILDHYPKLDGPASSILLGDWKLIRYYEFENGAAANRHELYDLSRDLGEQNDLAASEPDRVGELSELLDRRLAEAGALIPLPNPAYDPAARAPEEADERLGLFRVRDVNKDGRLSREEWSLLDVHGRNALLRRFDQLDRNGDGVLTRNEFTEPP